ncbi:MAG: hypothetical protein JWQ50_5878 [Caballeronia mineralivorans]|nr:hypothetical protein [Caballeronia mineralivorans]MEA3104684.1 hypothetical protein [Caballeronia mineralivorans]
MCEALASLEQRELIAIPFLYPKSLIGVLSRRSGTQRTKTSGDGCDAALGAYRLARENGPRVALRDLGMTQADPDRAADIVCRNP